MPDFITGSPVFGSTIGFPVLGSTTIVGEPKDTTFVGSTTSLPSLSRTGLPFASLTLAVSGVTTNPSGVNAVDCAGFTGSAFASAFGLPFSKLSAL